MKRNVFEYSEYAPKIYISDNLANKYVVHSRYETIRKLEYIYFYPYSKVHYIHADANRIRYYF